MNIRLPRILAFISLLFLPTVYGAIISGPYLQNVTENSIVVMWITDSSGNSTVEYGLTDSYGSSETGSSGTVHQVELTLLSADTEYHYRVETGGSYSNDAIFKTAPTKGTSGFTFIAYGDSRSMHYRHEEVALLMKAANVGRTFILNVGDIVPSSSSDAVRWQKDFFDPLTNLTGLINEIPLFGVIGNHEYNENYPNVLWKDYLINTYANDEYYYSFDYGNVHVTVIDTNQTSRGAPGYNSGTPQYIWIENDLSNASTDPDIDWIVVLNHQPPYATGTVHTSDTNIQNQLGPLFVTYGVDVMFSGDNHCYERVEQQGGVVYIVSGGGGASLYSQVASPPAWSVIYRSWNNYCIVTSEADTLTIVAHAVCRGGDIGDGDMIDSVVINKSGQWSPTALAGPDQMVNTGTLVTLDGTGSFDGDGDAFTSSWSQVWGPSATLSSTTADKPTFTPTEAGWYVFRLKCIEGALESHPDTVNILVKDAGLGGSVTLNPVKDTSVREDDPTSTWGSDNELSIDERYSSDPPGTELAYLVFDIPDVAGIVKAELRIYEPASVDFGGYVRTVSDTGWNEATVNYNNRPAIDGPIVGVLDGGSNWHEGDIVPAITGPGLLCIAVLPNTDDHLWCYSREASSNQPELVIHYAGVAIDIPGPDPDPTPLTASIDLPASDPYIVSTGDGSVVNFDGSATGGTEPYTSYDWEYEYVSGEPNDFNGLGGSHPYNIGQHTLAFQVTDTDSNKDIDTISVIIYDNGGTPTNYTDDSDWDDDGLPDGWEIFYFSDFDETGTSNPDGDGYNNATEYIRGTDPTVYDVSVQAVITSPANPHNISPDNTTVSFAGSSTDGTGIVMYEWDFEYDGSTFTVDDTGTNVSHAYPSSTGIFLAALRVTDEIPGIDIATVTINIQEPSTGTKGGGCGFGVSVSLGMALIILLGITGISARNRKQ